MELLEKEESSGSSLLSGITESLTGGSSGGSGGGILEGLIGLITGKREMPEGEVKTLDGKDPENK